MAEETSRENENYYLIFFPINDILATFKTKKKDLSDLERTILNSSIQGRDSNSINTDVPNSASLFEILDKLYGTSSFSGVRPIAAVKKPFKKTELSASEEPYMGFILKEDELKKILPVLNDCFGGEAYSHLYLLRGLDISAPVTFQADANQQKKKKFFVISGGEKAETAEGLPKRMSIPDLLKYYRETLNNSRTGGNINKRNMPSFINSLIEKAYHLEELSFPLTYQKLGELKSNPSLDALTDIFGLKPKRTIWDNISDTTYIFLRKLGLKFKYDYPIDNYGQTRFPSFELGSIDVIAQVTKVNQDLQPSQKGEIVLESIIAEKGLRGYSPDLIIENGRPRVSAITYINELAHEHRSEEKKEKIKKTIKTFRNIGYGLGILTVVGYMGYLYFTGRFDSLIKPNPGQPTVQQYDNSLTPTPTSKTSNTLTPTPGGGFGMGGTAVFCYDSGDIVASCQLEGGCSFNLGSGKYLFSEGQVLDTQDGSVVIDGVALPTGYTPAQAARQVATQRNVPYNTARVKPSGFHDWVKTINPKIPSCEGKTGK